MENGTSFKYELPEDCPEILIKEKGHQEGEYDILYFRICRHSPAEENDFIPHLFLASFSSRKKKIEEDNDCYLLCQSASVSLLQSKQDAVNLMKKFRKIGNYIYKGVLQRKHGLVLVTPSSNCPSHCSFFVYINVDEKHIFNKKVIAL